MVRRDCTIRILRETGNVFVVIALYRPAHMGDSHLIRNRTPAATLYCACRHRFRLTQEAPLVSDAAQHYRHRLLELRKAIESMEDSRRSSSATVELDQTRTGRLSRMDALQLQAMAKAGQARSQLELARIEAALTRIDQGLFGDCLECDEPIAAARLDANPVVTLCIDCASRRESRSSR